MRALKDKRVSIIIYSLLVGFCALTANLAAEVSAPVKEIEGLVRMQDIDPTIIVDLRYATENNFTKKKIYPVAVCVLRKETGEKLAAANKEFQQKGYRIKVWD